MKRRSFISAALAIRLHAQQKAYQPKRINKAIELLEQGQPAYYTYGAGGYEQGKALAKTWADIVLYDMEHAPFDLALLRQFMQGLVDGGPTPSGHRTPAVICTVPALGTDVETMKGGYWMVQQTLAAGVHGVHLCRARSPEAVRIYVQAARYPHHKQRVGEGLEEGLRGFGSQRFASKIWGIGEQEYFKRADPWPLNPEGEIMLGVKVEDKHAVQNAESVVRVPGVAFVDWGPRDMRLSYGFLDGGADPPHPKPLDEIQQRVYDACKAAKVHILDNVLPSNVEERIRAGVMIAAGGIKEAAEKGRRYTKREMPW
jgi:4-hydroxy-2-oxoheptanedioate aldolase